MLINQTIQSDFNAVTYSTDATGFETSKKKLLDDIGQLALVTTDPDTLAGLKAITTVVAAWTFSAPPVDNAVAPSATTLEMLQETAALVAPALEDLFDLLRRIMSLQRDWAQAEALDKQTATLSNAKDVYSKETSEAQSRYDQTVQEAAVQIVASTVTMMGDFAGIAKSFKAFRLHEEAGATRQEARELGEQLKAEEADVMSARTAKVESETELVNQNAPPAAIQKNREVWDEEVDTLESKVAKTRRKMQECTDTEEALKSTADAESRLGDILARLSQQVGTIMSTGGKLGTAYLTLDADQDKAQAQLLSAQGDVDRSMEQSFESYVSQIVDSVKQAMDTLKDILQAQAQLAGELGANLGA